MKYNFVESVTNKVLARNIELSEWEADKLNYAYCLNTNNRYSYVPVKTTKKSSKKAVKKAVKKTAKKSKELEVFKYNSPI